MLFDLRGRGRRRTVQVIYLTLAILMGGGLVLFGIGGNVSGGLFDAFQEDAGRGSGTEALERTVTSATAATQANPQDANAWARLVRARFQLAGADGGVDENTGAFTAKGKRALVGVERAWDRYVALEPDPPDDTAASYMVQAFSAAGLDKPDKAVGALEMVIQVRGDNANLYSQLAVLAYQAEQTRKGDLAADKAVRLAPAADRKLLRENLEAAKSQAAANATPERTVTATPSPASTTDTTSTTG
jgi:cytochrome c-type biogenesis protein CcmH/NrfG